MFEQEKVDDFIFRSKKIFNTLDKEEAYRIICHEIDSCENKYLHEYITILNFFRSEKVLDWLETNSYRITNITQSYGHLAASSYFTWERATIWLSKGRPLSLIALDAIMFCTTIGERLNQSPWMREKQPKLSDIPTPDIVARRLQDYLKIDKAPRVKTTINVIIDNIFHI